MRQPDTTINITLETDSDYSPRDPLYRTAYMLALITIGYNFIEGIVSIYFGLAGETLSLFGFGLDSFVEVISGMGILHMVQRIRRNLGEERDRFERRALRITGVSFYLLTAGLTFGAAGDLWSGHAPETTFWGIVIAVISIITMQLLVHHKTQVGLELSSDALLADANCTKACLYLSVVLLIASAGYALTGIGGLDSLGALGIAFWSFREGRESFEKAS